jgi:hypothetical protein
MIKDIIDLLTVNEYYGVSRKIDIAKGKYAIPYTWGQGWKQLKRIYNGR